MTAPVTGEGPDRPGLVTVFRSQAAEAQLTLLLCWLVLGLILTRSLIAAAPASGGSVVRYVVLVLGVEVLALVLLIRSQVVACRGGGHLRAGWVPPVLIGLALVPLIWGVLALAVVYAVAVVVLHYRAPHAAAICVLLSVVLVVALPGTQPISVLGILLELAMLVVLVVAVTVLAVRTDRLHLTREVLARRRVDLERDRVARDLHDLMGRTLVAASLRNQTALRVLGDKRPETAAMLERLHEMLSAGQVQLRSLTNGPTISNLRGELSGAKALCERVHIDLTVDIQEEPPGALDALLGLVVRENITNVLKHSQASWCRVSIGRQDHWVTVSVTNDGVLRPVGEIAEAGVDSRLARAVEAAGGEIRQGATPEGTYESIARIPVRELARSQATP